MMLIAKDIKRLRLDMGLTEMIHPADAINKIVGFLPERQAYPCGYYMRFVDFSGYLLLDFCGTI